MRVQKPHIWIKYKTIFVLDLDSNEFDSLLKPNLTEVSLKAHVDQSITLTGRGQTVNNLNILQTSSYESESSPSSALR